MFSHIVARLALGLRAQVLDVGCGPGFEAAILYDTMHHFHDELETLRVIRRTLVPGGRIFIHEGVRPEPGSERERELFAEMEQSARWSRHSIPSSFVSVLEEAGFEQVTRFAAFDELIDVSAIEEERRVEVPRQALPQSLPAGRSADIEIHVPRASVHGASEIRIDAVREGIAWFAGYGSSPLAVQLPDNP